MLAAFFDSYRQLGGLPRGAWLLAVAAFVNRAGTMAFQYLLLFLTTQHGYETQAAARVLLLHGAVAMLASPLGGFFADHFSARNVVIACLFVSAVGYAVIPAVATMPLLLYSAVALVAIGEQGARPAHLSLMSQMQAHGSSNARAAYSLNRLAVNLGMSIGPLLGGVVAAFSYEWVFVIDGATSFAAAILVFAGRAWLTLPMLEKTPAEASGQRAYRDGRLLYFLLALLPANWVFSHHVAMLSLFVVRDLGGSPALYGSLFTINTLIIVVFEVPFLTWLRRYDDRALLSSGALVTAVAFGGFAAVDSTAGLVMMTVLFTVGEMLLLPAGANFVSKLSNPSRRGEYMGLYSLQFSLAFALAPVWGAAISEHHGMRALWLVSFVVATLSALMLLRVSTDKHSASR